MEHGVDDPKNNAGSERHLEPENLKENSDKISRFVLILVRAVVTLGVVSVILILCTRFGLVGDLFKDSVGFASVSLIVVIVFYFYRQLPHHRGIQICIYLFLGSALLHRFLGLTDEIRSLDNIPVLGRDLLHTASRDILSATAIVSLCGSLYFLVQSLEKYFSQYRFDADRMTKEIAERKRAQALLSESEAKYRQIFEATSDGLIITDADGVIVEANDAACKMHGYGYEEFIGLVAADLADRDHLDHFSKLITNAGEKKEDATVTVNICKDGKPVNISVAGYPIIYQDGPYMLIVLRDITDQTQHEEHMRQLRVQLAHVSRVSTMGEMATGIAHELNQPLTAISTYSFLANRCLEDDNTHPKTERLRDIHGHLSKTVNRAADILRGIRSLMKKKDSYHEKCNLHKLIRDVVKLSQHEAKIRGVSFDLNLDESLPHVNIDEIQIQQVLINLIRNASEAMEECNNSDNKIVITTSHANSEMTEIAVQDSGKGLSADELNLIFDAFYTTKHEGMGMGLAICRSIIESHRGRLWAEVNSGGGMTFRFTVPLVEESEVVHGI